MASIRRVGLWFGLRVLWRRLVLWMLRWGSGFGWWGGFGRWWVGSLMRWWWWWGFISVGVTFLGCRFSWWWRFLCLFCVGANCGHLSCLLNGFHNLLWICPSDYCQLLLREINVQIIYTCGDKTKQNQDMTKLYSLAASFFGMY